MSIGTGRLCEAYGLAASFNRSIASSGVEREDVLSNEKRELKSFAGFSVEKSSLACA